MFLKADKYSAEQLTEIDASSVRSITIESSIEKGKIGPMKKLLQANQDLRIVLVVDPAIQERNGCYNNLDIAAAIGNLKHLSVLAFASTPLDNISQLEGLTELKTFRLSGAYKKDIDLRPLATAANIEELEMEYGLAGPKQAFFVNNLHRLRSLKVSVLDLKQVHLSSVLTELTVSNTLKSPELLSSVLPGVKSFSINYAKGIDTFDFIAQLKGLESLQIGYSSKLRRLPEMQMPSTLKHLSLISTKQFDHLDSILQFENLEELRITEPTQVPLPDFKELKDLRHLKRVNIVFKTEPEDLAFAEMAKTNGWTTVY
ncbi:hypothetical protein AB6805_13765 [Chitinophaga sp. RCC_12]|uniref:hypothetical protein n=1 Tax=Chitinophaga sp. RCC_12 TaxID=3239226 RepID=UPI003525EB86